MREELFSSHFLYLLGEIARKASLLEKLSPQVTDEVVTVELFSFFTSSVRLRLPPSPTEKACGGRPAQGE